MLHCAVGALINVSCDDPGAAVGQQLALPILQERLDACARKYAAQRAAAAEEAIIKEEVRAWALPVYSPAFEFQSLITRLGCK